MTAIAAVAAAAGALVVNIGTTLPVEAVDTVPVEPELVDKVEADPLIYFKSTNGSEDI